ncbi:uncharacterized protein LOC123870065 [Maniola jurtina]|uniref:uncharacterized protein LOC123870065 n=1 Tax=Maniola jurtina TaxID=191418 RepID=UPI001E68E623|nr:uncharacterized protein LOC123870065 [Maniola jurtina]XP_045769186.1 uncharacterized protein LOC123870065 [Maniola jurtina]XP_045769187.1 uncharacterized protein LOC123870065 [Maniola jurtina]
MPFSVVQTIEKGELRLTAVPDLWVHNKLLFWPKKSADKLRRQENSSPDASWEIMSCDVKRKNLKTFQEAQDEINTMSDKSDTETDEGDTNRRSLRKEKYPLPDKSFNELAKTLTDNHNQMLSTTTPVTQVAQKSQEDTNCCFVPQDQIVGTVEGNIPVTIPESNFLFYTHTEPEISTPTNEIEAIKESIATIIANQNSLHEIQTNMCVKISEIQTELRSFIKMSVSQKRVDEEPTLIKNIKDLEEFEKNLSNRTFKDNMLMKFVGVCSKGLGKGGVNAYHLVDSLFERNFLKQCTWTGFSKKEAVKICFKAFTRTISLFFDIIHATDESFTKVDCDKFFKTILKNAHKRSESNQRMSAPKVRVIKRKRTAKTLPIDVPIENVNGEGSGQNSVETPDLNNEERSDQNDVEIFYQSDEERPDKTTKGCPTN